MNKHFLAGVVVLMAASGPAGAQDWLSQDFIKGGEETLTINLGGILNQFNTTLRLDGQGLSGTDIDLERNGLKNSLSSFEVSGTWRFWSRNRVDLLYFTAKRTGSHRTEREIVIDGNVIPIDFTLAVQAEDQFLLGDYRYSFVKTPEVEFAVGVGIYGGRFKYTVNASGMQQGQMVNIDTSASTTVPLPLIGVSLDWYINPRWKISGNVEGAKARIRGIDGRAIVAGATTEFMLARNLGLGLAYLYTDLDVNATKSGFNGNFGWTMNSVRAYAQLKF